jgi:hypothetical protein
MDRRSRTVDKEVDWVLSHPARARAWSDSGKISAVAMAATLALGLAVHVAGFAIGSGALPAPDWLPVELTATLVSNLGIVLWTSVVLVVFLDTLPARARRRAARSLALAAQALEERGLPVPGELAEPTTINPTSGPDSDGTLQRVLERLERIEELLARK